VCLSAVTCPHYCTDPDATRGSGRGCPLVRHCCSDLQSMHGFRCYDNIARTRNVDECMYSLYAWFYRCTAYTVYFHCLRVRFLRVTLNINRSINQPINQSVNQSMVMFRCLRKNVVQWRKTARLRALTNHQREFTRKRYAGHSPPRIAVFLFMSCFFYLFSLILLYLPKSGRYKTIQYNTYRLQHGLQLIMRV